jgi:hypothetical protein
MVPASLPPTVPVFTHRVGGEVVGQSVLSLHASWHDPNWQTNGCVQSLFNLQIVPTGGCDALPPPHPAASDATTENKRPTNVRQETFITACSPRKKLTGPYQNGQLSH